MNLDGLQFEFFIGAAGALLLGLLLLALRRPDRALVRGMLVALTVSVAIELLALLLQVDYPRAARPLSAMALFGLGAVIIRLASILLFRQLLPQLRFAPARIVEDLFTTALGAAWLLFWLHGLGLDLASLLTTSAVITAVLAFSMQDTLGNVLGGVVLQLDDSVRVGDWVKIDDISGQVVDVRWRHTAVETRNRETVVIPNGWLVKNRFIVIGSRKDPKPRWRRWVWFNIDIGAPPKRVCQVLEDAVRYAEINNVVKDPPPTAVLMDVGQGYGRYALRYWMADPRPDDPTDSAVRQHALAALARNGMRLAVVTEERLITKENDARRERLQAGELDKRRQALSGVEIFDSLSDDERDVLAAALVDTPFVAGDTVTRQGAVAHWLYLIIAGEADVWTEDAGKRSHVASLKSGSVVGEMGMMTGEPRRATVTAKTDLQCYRLDKAAFESILRARPDLASEISEVILHRRDQLETARAAAGNAAPTSGQGDDLRARIRSFFGLDEA